MRARKRRQSSAGTLGYYAGYFDAATRARVERLFQCEHPFFGKIAERGQPTPEDAYDMGFLRAVKITSNMNIPSNMKGA